MAGVQAADGEPETIAAGGATYAYFAFDIPSAGAQPTARRLWAPVVRDAVFEHRSRRP